MKKNFIFAVFAIMSMSIVQNVVSMNPGEPKVEKRTESLIVITKANGSVVATRAVLAEPPHLEEVPAAFNEEEILRWLEDLRHGDAPGGAPAICEAIELLMNNGSPPDARLRTMGTCLRLLCGSG